MFIRLIITLSIFSSSLVLSQQGASPQHQYLSGVDTAEKTESLKQDRPLFNIGSANSQIEVACRPDWKCVPDKAHWEEKGKFKPNVRVKMVTLAGSVKSIYEGYLGSKRKYPLQGRIIWVTAFPELKNFCKNITDKRQIKSSLEKYLGLPPDTNKEVFITIWVKPEDIFRPCYSPDITTTTCPSQIPPGVPREHINWVTETFAGSYKKDPNSMAYPFTKMGYAFFWGNPKSMQGGSEYVVKPNAKIFVESVESLETYCSN
ncbi:MAG: hypothetical protein ACHQYQ_06495 [Bacteriovoracales bacterium]